MKSSPRCPPCYLLKALLVPGLAVDAVGGDLPPVGDVLADLGPVAVPLAPLVVGLGCGEANLVLLQGLKADKDVLSADSCSTPSIHTLPTAGFLPTQVKISLRQ